MHVQNSAVVPPAHGARDLQSMKHAKLPPGLAKPAPAHSHQPPATPPQTTLTPALEPPATNPLQAASTPPVTELPAEPQMTLDGLLESFGQKGDSPYDLNTDGVVNVLDLIQFLMEGGGSPLPMPTEQPDPSVLTAPETAPMPAPDVATQPSAGESALEAGPPEGEDTDAPLTLEGLLKSWGQTDSPYDLNTDGIVNVLDLIEFLLDNTGPNDPGPADPNVSRDSVAVGGRLDTAASLAQERQRLGQVADSLLGGLARAGFEEHPPASIHDMVDALQLSGRQKQVMMSHLDAHYHNGLGLNLVG